MRSKKHIFLHGQGGTGKTYIVKHLLDLMDEDDVFVTSATGMSAKNLHHKATTLDYIVAKYSN
jgi:type II secretory pathway predicted ATPase ExeA